MLWIAFALFLAALAFAMVVTNLAKPFTITPSTPHVDIAVPHMVSLIVPARNAAATLTPLLQDLHAQNYPKEKLEIIVVDDASDDGTRRVVQEMMRTWRELQLITADGAGKKAAITTGVRAAKGELILITDADARCGSDRVRSVVEHWHANGADMLLLPVRTLSEGGYLGRLQEDEQAALLGVAAGAASMGKFPLAYGANMAFTRVAFFEVSGYDGDRYSSGDDVFLLERMRKAGKRIVFDLDPATLVTVAAEGDVKAFLNQRLRWAGKMRGVSGASSMMGLLVLLLPFALAWASWLFKPVQAMGDQAFQTGMLLAVAWCFWLVPVIRLVATVRLYLGQNSSAPIALLNAFAFTIYAPVIAILSLFVRPEWKGRKVRA